jgi:integrase
MKVTAVAERYVAEAGRIRTPASAKSFMKVMRLLDYQMGGAPVDTITTEQLTKFCLGGYGTRTLAPATIKHRRGHVRAVWEWAAWTGIIDHNAASDLKFTVNAGNHHLVRQGNWLDESDVRNLLEVAADQPPLTAARDRLVLIIGFLTGLRAFEICPLRWSSFGPDYRTFTVLGKGAKPATIGSPGQLAGELGSWRLQVPAGVDTLLPTIHQVGADGVWDEVPAWQVPIGYDGVYRIVRKVGKRAGYPRLAPHDMRRSYAAILESKGMPVTDISRALRHKNVGITSKYLDTNPQKAIEVTSGVTFDL